MELIDNIGKTLKDDLAIKINGKEKNNVTKR